MLEISEIYATILGESRFAGLPGVIVRLAGCHRRCVYCDTRYALDSGEFRSRREIIASVRAFGLDTVLVTGGEPLLQAEVVELLEQLTSICETVVLETSGTVATVALDQVPAGVRRVVDVKTPGSGLDESCIDWSGLAGLGADDEVKIVCCDRDDYEWACDLVQRSGRLPASTPVSFSAAAGSLSPAELAAWILADKLGVRLQIQLHKVLWPDVERGV